MYIMEIDCEAGGNPVHWRVSVLAVLILRTVLLFCLLVCCL